MTSQARPFRQGELLWMQSSFASKLIDGIGKSNAVTFDCMQNTRKLLQNNIELTYLSGQMQELQNEVSGYAGVVGGAMQIGGQLISLGGTLGYARDLKNAEGNVQDNLAADAEQVRPGIQVDAERVGAGAEQGAVNRGAPLSEAQRQAIANKWANFEAIGKMGQAFGTVAEGAGKIISAPFYASDAKYRADAQAAQADMESTRSQQSTTESVGQSAKSALEQDLGLFAASCQWMAAFRA